MMGSNIAGGESSGTMDTLGRLIDLAANPEQSKQLIADLREAQAKYDAAVRELQLGQSAADALKAAEKAKAEAAELLDEAKTEAGRMISEAQAKVKDLQQATKAAYDEVQADKRALETARKGVDVMQRKLDSEVTEATRQRELAAELRIEYETKLKAAKAKIAEMEAL